DQMSWQEFGVDASLEAVNVAGIGVAEAGYAAVGAGERAAATAAEARASAEGAGILTSGWESLRAKGYSKLASALNGVGDAAITAGRAGQGYSAGFNSASGT